MNKEEPKLIVFSPEVENAITSVISSSDPLDAPDFDPIEYINNKFPDENSLNKLKSYRENLDEAIIKLDRDINEAVKQQSTAGKEAEEELERAKGAIETLCDKINEIHDKANQSEVMVEDICKDIKKLDIAKKHLSSSTAALERLQMLVKSLDELESYCINRDYEKASTVISAVNEISNVFKEYESVKKIKDIEDRVKDIKNKFGIIILADFSEIESINKDFIDVDDPEYEEVENLKMKLKYACLVLDHLDKSIKMELINKFCNNQMQAYGQMFYPAVSKQESNFKNVIRRFTFFKKVLKKYENIYEAIFPSHWKMKARLSIQFLLITRKHYEMMLKPREEFKDNGEIMKVEQHIDIGEMVTALKQSIAFERKAMSLFDDENDNEFDDDDDDVGNASERIRRQLKAKNKQKNKNNNNEDDDDKEKEDEIDKLPSPEGMITNIFEDYMNDYIILKENILNSIVDSSLDDKGFMNNGGLYVLSSFQNILKTVRSVIQECSTLNTGKIFYEIYQRIVLCLMNYCEVLNKKLPQPKTSSSYIIFFFFFVYFSSCCFFNFFFFSCFKWWRLLCYEK